MGNLNGNWGNMVILGYALLLDQPVSEFLDAMFLCYLYKSG